MTIDSNDSAPVNLEKELANYSEMMQAAGRSTSPKRNLRKACVGFGVATSAALIAGSELDADVIYSGIQNKSITGTATTSIDIDGAGNDFQFRIGMGGGIVDISPLNAGDLLAGNGLDAQRFEFNSFIGTAGSSLGSAFGFGSYAMGEAAGFTSNPGFLGVQLASGNFGWIQVNYTAPTWTVVDWAFDNTGNHLLAGDGIQSTGLRPGNDVPQAIPEPSSSVLAWLGLLSMGVAGIRELRRRKVRHGTGD